MQLRKVVGSAVRVVILMILVAALAASASAPKQHTVAKAMRTGATFDHAWSAVIEVFADRNWAIQNMAKDSGLITTDWMDVGTGSTYADCGGSGLASVVSREIRFNIFVRELDGEGSTGVTVNATFREQRSWDRRQWYVECYSTGQVERLIHGLVGEAVGRRARRLPATAPTSMPVPVAGPEQAPAPPAPADGTLGGRCYGNQTCNAGLVCDDILGQCGPGR